MTDEIDAVIAAIDKQLLALGVTPPTDELDQEAGRGEAPTGTQGKAA